MDLYCRLFSKTWVYHYHLEVALFFFPSQAFDFLMSFEDLNNFSLYYQILFLTIYLVLLQKIEFLFHIRLLTSSFNHQISSLAVNYFSLRYPTIFLIICLEHWKRILVSLHNHLKASSFRFVHFVNLFWLDLTLFLIIFIDCLLRKPFFFSIHQQVFSFLLLFDFQDFQNFFLNFLIIFEVLFTDCLK